MSEPFLSSPADAPASVGPALSVVLATPDTFETIRETVDCLRAQTLREQIELVIVAPEKSKAMPDAAAVQGFGACQVVEMESMHSVVAARALGIREAGAPLVALAEDHAFPEPGWAAALVAAHRGEFAGVGPVITNANPRTMISWADLLVGYGPWLEPVAAGVVEHLPGHNSCYKRAILLEYGPQLEAMLEAESVLHWDLRARGMQLYLEPAARTRHTNFSRLGDWTNSLIYNGRIFADARVRNEGWSWPRRFAFCAGSPLIPLVRLARILRRNAPTLRAERLWLRVLPALFYGLVVDAAGQMVGYVLGAGAAPDKWCPMEFHRARHNAEPGQTVAPATLAASGNQTGTAWNDLPLP